MRVAIIGSGKIGATLARRLTETGHEVTLANSRGADIARSRSWRSSAPARTRRADIVGRCGGGRVVVLAVPFFLYDRLPPAAFAGKVVDRRHQLLPRPRRRHPRAAGRQHDVERADRRAPSRRARRQGVQHDGLDPARRGRPPRRRPRSPPALRRGRRHGRQGHRAACWPTTSASTRSTTEALAAGRAQQPGSAVYGVPHDTRRRGRAERRGGRARQQAAGAARGDHGLVRRGPGRHGRQRRAARDPRRPRRRPGRPAVGLERLPADARLADPGRRLARRHLRRAARVLARRRAASASSRCCAPSRRASSS